MKKKEQQKLIEKTLQSPKPNQDCPEFKKLQMYWYEKLESSTPFQDIERTGLNRSKYYNEYNGLIRHSSWSIADKYNFATHAHYQMLRYFSWHAIVTSASPVFDASKPFKVRKIALNNTSNPSLTSPDLQNTIKTQKLSPVDAKILYLIGDGAAISKVSSFLRRYLSHHASRSRTGPKGQPFSAFYVHTRLHKLLKSIQTGEIYVADEGGGVKKSGFDC